MPVCSQSVQMPKNHSHPVKNADKAVVTNAHFVQTKDPLKHAPIQSLTNDISSKEDEI
jgi:hypothetical protein